METQTIVHSERYGIPRYAGHRLTKTEFLRWESDDNYVYEFNNGVLEPTTSMRQDEILLFKRLTRRFAQTQAYQQEGELLAEVDVWIREKQMRRPDVAYYTADQVSLVATGRLVIPGFVVEFASESDNERVSLTKRHEYFDAGVQVIWWVYPEFKEVYVYTSPKIVTICTDDDVLSAAPVLPELQMAVAELFKK
ncbi:Uma2 family endonuclease [Spirosoma areae]